VSHFRSSRHEKSNECNNFSIQDIAQKISNLIKEQKHDQQVIRIGFSLGAQVLITILINHRH